MRNSWRKRLARLNRRRTFGLIALATAARALYWLSTIDYTPISDAGSYQAIATNLAHGRGFSDYFPQLAIHETAFRPPLYPSVLAGVYRVFGTSVGLGRLVSLITGVVVVLLVERLVTRTGGSIAGLVAAMCVALYPPLVANDVSILTESLSLLLLVLIFSSAADERWVVAGIETGLLVLTRHSAQAFALVLAIVFVFWIGWRRALGYLAISALVIVPWVVRNEIQLGSPVVNTANGFNLAAMYSQEAHASGGFVDPVFDPRFEDLRLLQFDEVKWDERLRERGLSGLREHPLDLLHVTGNNTLGYFELKPWEGDGAERLDGRNMTVRRAAIPVYYAVTVAGIAGLWLSRRHRVAQLASLSAAYFSVVSILSVAPPRLRAPFDLACCIGVGLLAGHLAARTASTRLPERPPTGSTR